MDLVLHLLVVIALVLVVTILGMAPSFWRTMWRAGHDSMVLRAALRPGLTSLVMSVASTVGLALLLALLAPSWVLGTNDLVGGTVWGHGRAALPYTASLAGMSALPLWALFYLFCRRAQAAVFMYRPDLLAVTQQEARQQLRSGSNGRPSSWTTAGARHRGRSPRTRKQGYGSPPGPTYLMAHAGRRQGAIQRARTRDSLTLRGLALCFAIWTLLRVVVVVRGVTGGPFTLPDQLMPVALVVIPLLLGLTVYVERRRTREAARTEDFSTAVGMEPGAVPTQFEKDQLDRLVRRIIAASALARLGTALSTLVTASTALAAARRISPTRFTASLVADPIRRGPTLAVHHHLALAMRTCALDPGFALSVVPRGLGLRSMQNAPLESDAFNQRFDTATNVSTLAHAVLTPLTMEALLALPDGVGVVMDEQHVLVICLLPAPADVLAVLATTARFLATAGSPYWSWDTKGASRHS